MTVDFRLLFALRCALRGRKLATVACYPRICSVMDSNDDLSALRIERAPAPPSRRWVKWVVLLVLVAAAGVGGWQWLNRERPIEVEVAAVTVRGAGTQASVLNASGYVTARRRATVSSKVTGTHRRSERRGRHGRSRGPGPRPPRRRQRQRDDGPDQGAAGGGPPLDPGKRSAPGGGAVDAAAPRAAAHRWPGHANRTSTRPARK